MFDRGIPRTVSSNESLLFKKEDLSSDKGVPEYNDRGAKFSLGVVIIDSSPVKKLV